MEPRPAIVSSSTLSANQRGCGLFTTRPSSCGQVKVSSHTIEYEIHGTGSKRVCLVMGFMTHMAGWDTTISNFLLPQKDLKEPVQETLDEPKDYAFLVINNRGIGESRPGNLQLYSTSALAKDVLAVLDHIEWHQKVHLVGISMGGMISLELACSHPERFKSLSLLVSGAYHAKPKGRCFESVRNLVDNSGSVDDKVHRLINSIFSQEWLAEKHDRFPEFPDNRARVHKILKHRAMVTRKPELRTLLGQLWALKTHNVSKSRLNKLGRDIKDIICLGAGKDLLFDPACMRYTATCISCKYIEFPNKGHVITSEAEVEVYDYLRNNFESAEARFALETH